ncbi:hypothetical protein [Pseudonocardia abyssalis]|uniref:Uncharacterized protein n=1 Tax=Pseudonocardia abyssalis TaxID=2792008 RepID=A0ABS6UX22_9PSEU|nr:hypothetical protein [Pseudonocardia abyssalis]MBW0119423.1 hypothetical protein [Pseudonocardia abyssalis]MBW0136794.1 hypothetical protein [Pseudonocardia abyssalis]
MAYLPACLLFAGPAFAPPRPGLPVRCRRAGPRMGAVAAVAVGPAAAGVVGLRRRDLNG